MRLYSFLVALVAIALPLSALADTAGGNFTGTVDGFDYDIDAMFSWDESCSSDCELQIMLTYNSSDPSPLNSIGQTLAGVTWDTAGSASFDRSLSQVLAESFVGAGSAQATSDLSTADGLDVSGHYAYKGDLNVDGLGMHILSSVGDVNFGEDSVGTADLLPGFISSVENNPPNGTEFTIVTDATCTAGTCNGLNGGFQDGLDRVWIQNSIKASLAYDGGIEGISNIVPIFGTDGKFEGPIPEPTAALLYGVGLVVFGAARRLR